MEHTNERKTLGDLCVHGNLKWILKAYGVPMWKGLSQFKFHVFTFPVLNNYQNKQTTKHNIIYLHASTK